MILRKKYRKYNHLHGGVNHDRFRQFYYKNEYEEFMFLERKLSKEQKQAVLNIMTGIIR